MGFRLLHSTDFMTRTPEQERELFLRFKQDPSAIGEIYDLFADPLFGFVLKRCRHKETAEDVVSQAFTKLLESRETLLWQGVSIRAWLYAVASNTLIDHQRKASTKREVELDPEWDPPSADDPAWNVQMTIDGEKLKAALTQLSARDQHLIDLRFFAGLEPQEIAVILKITANHASVLIYRAIGRLRQVALQANIV